MPIQHPLHLDASTFRMLLLKQGPSLALWRAAEVAALREITFEHPILDLGCGDGLVTSQVLSHVEVGLDPDKRVLQRAATLNIYQRFEQVTAEEMQLPDASIETVVSNSVLEHLPRLDKTLQSIARVLRPGGKLVFTSPTEKFSTWLVLPLKRYASWRNHKLYHLNLWSLECWRRHLEQVGLEIEEVRPYLRHKHVFLWDAFELLQQIWIGRKRLVSLLWGLIPQPIMNRIAQWASQQNLSSPQPGGGRLIIARKWCSKSHHPL
jgi:SAM-dependent methyltransferase